MRNAVIAILLASGSAVAEPTDERSARDVAGAPVPGEESGRVDERDERISTSRKIGRGVLFVPRTALDIAFLPVRGLVWLYDRYQPVDRWKRIFFNEAETMGVYPVAQLQSGFGFDAGLKFMHRDLFGERERVMARFDAGGRYKQRFTAGMRSGDRLGDVFAVELRGEYERRPKEPYYGIGNDGEGTEARHRQQLARTTLAIDMNPIGGLHVRGAGALSDLQYGPSDSGTSIEMVYPPSTLNGFDGVRNAYGELELRWDGRRQSDFWESPVPATVGWYVAAFGGRVHQLGIATDYWRFGIDAQHALSLGVGPRVLAARLHAEAVTGHDTSFTELPQLGGKYLLRGYPIDRFRDRVAAVGSLEYRWDLNRHASANLFVDAGRVYQSVYDLGFEDLRIGYGLGVQFHRSNSFVAEASIASSKDGGVFVNLAFDPSFEVAPREHRR